MKKHLTVYLIALAIIFYTLMNVWLGYSLCKYECKCPTIFIDSNNVITIDKNNLYNIR